MKVMVELPEEAQWASEEEMEQLDPIHPFSRQMHRLEEALWESDYKTRKGRK